MLTKPSGVSTRTGSSFKRTMISGTLFLTFRREGEGHAHGVKEACDLVTRLRHGIAGVRESESVVRSRLE